MTINIKNFLKEKSKLSKMESFKALNKLKVWRCHQYLQTYMEMVEMI